MIYEYDIGRLEKSRETCNLKNYHKDDILSGNGTWKSFFFVILQVAGIW